MTGDEQRDDNHPGGGSVAVPDRSMLSKSGAKLVLRTKKRIGLSSRSAGASIVVSGQPRPTPDREQAPQRLTTLLGLPTELFLQILELLSTRDAICLSLTCRGIYPLISQHPIIQPLTSFGRLRLLYRFERDLAEYISCYRCEKLYLWRKQINVQRRWRSSPTLPFIHSVTQPCLEYCESLERIYLCGKYHHRTDGKRSSIYPALRHLILRHEVLGPDFGIPMSTLAHSCKNKAVKGKTGSSTTIEPKIVRSYSPLSYVSNLMIRKTTQIAFRENLKPGEIYRYQPLTAWDPFTIVCQHVGVLLCTISQHVARFLQQPRHDSFKQEFGEVIGLPSEDKNNQSFKAPFETWYRCTKLLKCHLCATDFRIYARAIDEEIFEVKFDVFHDFGFLRGVHQAVPWQQAGLLDGHWKPLGTHYRLTTSMVIDRLNPDLEKLYNEQKPLKTVKQYATSNRLRDPTGKYYYPWRDARKDVAFAAQYQGGFVRNEDAPYPLCFQLENYIDKDWSALKPWINAGEWIGGACWEHRAVSTLQFESCG